MNDEAEGLLRVLCWCGADDVPVEVLEACGAAAEKVRKVNSTMKKPEDGGLLSRLWRKLRGTTAPTSPVSSTAGILSVPRGEGVEAALEELAAASLVKYEAGRGGARSVSMHRVVQEIMRAAERASSSSAARHGDVRAGGCDDGGTAAGRASSGGRSVVWSAEVCVVALAASTPPRLVDMREGSFADRVGEWSRWYGQCEEVLELMTTRSMVGGDVEDGGAGSGSAGDGESAVEGRWVSREGLLACCNVLFRCGDTMSNLNSMESAEKMLMTVRGVGFEWSCGFRGCCGCLDVGVSAFSRWHAGGWEGQRSPSWPLQWLLVLKWCLWWWLLGCPVRRLIASPMSNVLVVLGVGGQALKVRQELLPENHVDVAGALFSLGGMEVARHRWQKAVGWTEKVR